MREEDRALLEELLLARGPGGQEDEVRAICQRELEGLLRRGRQRCRRQPGRAHQPAAPAARAGAAGRGAAARAPRRDRHDRQARRGRRYPARSGARRRPAGELRRLSGTDPGRRGGTRRRAVLRQHACYRRVAAGLRTCSRARCTGATYTWSPGAAPRNWRTWTCDRVPAWCSTVCGGARCTSRIASPRTSSTTAHRCSPCSAWLARSPGAATSCTATSTWCSPPWRRRVTPARCSPRADCRATSASRWKSAQR